MNVSEFVEQWSEVGFTLDPPNVVLRHDFGDGLGEVLVMSDPMWDQPAGSLSFTATVEDHEAGTEPLPWLMSDVSLFIDDSGSSYHRVTLSISNAAAGQDIGVVLGASGSRAPSWSLGANESDSAGLSLTSNAGPAPLDGLEVTDDEVRIETSGDATGATVSFRVELFLEAVPGAGTFEVRSTSAPGAEITLALDGAEPQVVNAAGTPFELDGS